VRRTLSTRSRRESPIDKVSIPHEKRLVENDATVPEPLAPGCRTGGRQPVNAGLQGQIHSVVPRTRAFLEATEPGHFLVNAGFPVEGKPAPALDRLHLDDPDDLHLWLGVQLENKRAFWKAREGLPDDHIPSIAPFFGYAEHAAWLGLKVVLQPATSLAVPAYDDIARVPRELSFSEDAPWVRLMRESYAWLREQQRGDFVLAVRGGASPMELANSLRGDDIFMDFLEEPEHCHRLMNALTELYPSYFDLLRSWADRVEGGFLSAYLDAWMGPDPIGHLSNDTAMLCSAAVYKEFGFPYEARLLSRYNGAFYHVHSEKMHYVPMLARLPNLRLIQVQEDPRVGSNMKNLEAIMAATGDCALMLAGSPEEIIPRLDLLATRNVYLRAWCADRNEAESLVAAVRSHSKPLAGPGI